MPLHLIFMKISVKNIFIIPIIAIPFIFFQLNESYKDILIKKSVGFFVKVSSYYNLLLQHNENKCLDFAYINTHECKSDTIPKTILTKQLDSIYLDDQKYRQQFEDIYIKHGPESIQMKALWNIMNKTDSLNLKKIKLILHRYGWLGPETVGSNGNSAFFLVIQHSDKETQQQYLPLMRSAVKNKKANAQDLALLEDRVSLKVGKKQIYGSQIGRDDKTQKFYLLPLLDPDNVDNRRAKIGLGPIAEYLSEWQIDWNLVKYKDELSLQEAKSKNK